MTQMRKTLLALLTALMFTLPVLAADELHTAYIGGFPDGSIRPLEPLTREQLAMALYRLIPDGKSCSDSAQSCFTDVAPDRWSYEAVSVMTELGILSEVQQGQFCPEQGVTRPELAEILIHLADNDAVAEVLPELVSGWKQQQITFSAGNGWVMGFDGSCFCPEEPVTRAAFIEIFNQILGRNTQTLDQMLVGMPLWSDNLDAQTWYFTAVQEAAVTHTCTITAEGELWTGLG